MHVTVCTVKKINLGMHSLSGIRCVAADKSKNTKCGLSITVTLYVMCT